MYTTLNTYETIDATRIPSCYRQRIGYLPFI